MQDDLIVVEAIDGSVSLERSSPTWFGDWEWEWVAFDTVDGRLSLMPLFLSAGVSESLA